MCFHHSVYQNHTIRGRNTGKKKKKKKKSLRPLQWAESVLTEMMNEKDGNEMKIRSFNWDLTRKHDDLLRYLFPDDRVAATKTQFLSVIKTDNVIRRGKSIHCAKCEGVNRMRCCQPSQAATLPSVILWWSIRGKKRASAMILIRTKEKPVLLMLLSFRGSSRVSVKSPHLLLQLFAWWNAQLCCQLSPCVSQQVYRRHLI